MAASQVPTIPYLSTPQEKQNFLDAVLLVSLDDIQRPQLRLEKLDGLTPTEQLDLTLLARGINLATTSNNTTPARTLAAPKLPPGSASAMSMSLATEVSWKTTRFLSALFRLMLRGPPRPCKRPSSNSVAFAHTMLINGAEGPAMSLCAQAMKSEVVHKVVDGVVDSRRGALDRRNNPEHSCEHPACRADSDVLRVVCSRFQRHDYLQLRPRTDRNVVDKHDCGATSATSAAPQLDPTVAGFCIKAATPDTSVYGQRVVFVVPWAYLVLASSSDPT
ncbi:500fd014-35e3-46e7-b512-dd099fb62b87 [Thermothielavioides terrestris]|uniref:500fd014-35e3-46e7-b512-dd099fb62b87 n=1 Tax=Thermothielavioides terrestris TaxID=2587410 RepID=A0A446BP93_9PEZI|nr:500fd014-35e3-46e7-b512-dd099fb62b87 [Thermothielavioides terrestris]